MNPVEEPADLTPLQRKYLGNLHEFCRKPPTLAYFYMKAMPVYVLKFILFGLLCWTAVLYEMIEAAYVLGGILFGTMLSDWTNFRRALLLWPATSAVVDRAMLSKLTDLPAADDSEQW